MLANALRASSTGPPPPAYGLFAAARLAPVAASTLLLVYSDDVLKRG